MKTCQQCNYEVQDGARFCPNCGYKFTEATAAGAAQEAAVTPVTQASPNVPSIVSPPPASSVASLQTPPTPGSAPTSPAATKKISNLLHDRYMILQKLGEGGMGAVYLAEDTSLFGKKCIIKEMLPYYSNDQEKQEAEKFFLREVQLLAQLKHPGIPQIFDHFIISDHYYYVMEFAEGKTLLALAEAKNGRLPETELLEYARQIIDVLDCISSRPEPIIHRDIKPENIIVDTTTGQAKLVDFGLAKAQSSKPIVSGDKSTSLGTPGYAPPEQYQGKAEPRSDVFALGATMHHMLTGVDPRNASAPFQYDPLIRLNPTLSQFTIGLVERMLNLNVAQRPTAQQIKQQFSNVRAGMAPAQGQGMQVGNLPQSPTQLSGLAFNFRSGASARNVDEMCQFADRYWNDGVYHLYQGDFERWLRAQGMNQYADAAGHIRTNNLNDRNAGLEEFLHQLNPSLAVPALQVSASAMNLGQVEKGSKRTVTIEISNGTRGYLYGAVQSLAPWLRVNPARVSVLGGTPAGGKQTLSIEIDTNSLAMGKIQTDGLEIHTNGGSLPINIEMQVSWPPRVKVTPNTLSLGAVLTEQRGTGLTGQLVIYNDGGSTLQGDLRTNTPWISLSPGQPTQINVPSEQSITVQVLANTAMMQANQISEGSLIIQTPLETVTVPVKAGIRKASFTPARRALYWAGYLALWLISTTLITYPLAMILHYFQGGFSPDGLLQTVPPAVYVKLFQMISTQSFLPYNITTFSVFAVIAVALILLGVIVGRLARLLIAQLDEIELYYSPQLRSALPAWSFDAKLALYTRIGLLVLGLLAVTLSKTMPFEWYIRIPFGLALGAALAFGLVLPTSAGPQHAVRLPFRILAALGLMGLRMMMLPTCTILEAALWGVFGLLLAPSLNAPMPLRWRAVQAYYRPTFLALALAMMAAGLTRWVFYQTDTIFYSYYGVLGSLRFIDTLAYIIWIAAALTGAFLAMRMMKPMGYSGQPPFSPRVFWTLLTATSLIVLLAYFIVRLPFERVPYSSWIVLILSAGMAGGIAVFSLRRKQAAQHWLLKTVQTMGRTSGKLALQTKSGSLTQKATSLPERAARRLQSLLGPAPLDGLTPVTAATAATISTLVITMLAITVWSFFALFISLLGFLIVAAVLAWIGYMVWKANRK